MTTSLGAPRWRGEGHRLEVWYLTATDRATGTGLWIHHETVAPPQGRRAYGHGWAAVFEPDREPVVERFGREPATPTEDEALEHWHRVDGCDIRPGASTGSAGVLSWDLRWTDGSGPLYTFPRWAWTRQVLPGAQVVPEPTAQITGAVTVEGRDLRIDARGALARIYGHGNAQRWGWLHADLDGDGVIEIVTATPRRPGLRRLRPLAFVQVRLTGRGDWPAHSLLAAPRFRTSLRSDGFDVTGTHRGQTLDVRVQIPRERAVALRYEDPDGATATCTNSETSSASVTLTGRSGSDSWHLDGTAHAEVGTRP